MATIVAFSQLNMANLQVWYGNVTGDTSTQITVTDGYDTGIYYGSFTYPGSSVAGGLTGDLRNTR